MAKMVLLNWVMISQQNFDYDSNFVVLKNFVEGMRKDGRAIVVATMPKGARLYTSSVFEENKDILIPVSISFPSSKKHQNGWFDSKLFYDLLEHFGVCVVFNHIPELAILMRNAMLGYDHEKMIVGTFYHWTIHPTLGELEYNVFIQFRDLQILGAKWSDILFFNSEYNKWMFFDELDRSVWGRHFKKEFEKKSRVVGLPVVTDYMRKLKVEGGDNRTVIYNHRMEFYKRSDITFKVFDDLAKEGYDFTVELSASGAGKAIKYGNRPYVKPFFKPHHDEYLKHIAKKHINTINTEHETFCIAIAESAYLGGLPIVPRGITFPELFGEDYPYMFNSVAEQKQMLRDAFRDKIDESWREKLRQRIEEKYSCEAFTKRVMDAFEEVIYKRKEQYNVTMKEKTKEHIKQFKRENRGDEMPIKEFLKRFREDKYGMQAMPATLIMMLLYGDVEFRVRNYKIYAEVI